MNKNALTALQNPPKTDSGFTLIQSEIRKQSHTDFLVLSLASKISYDAFSIENVVMGVNYGLDKVRFPNATKSDAKLEAESL